MEWECFWVNLREDNKVSESKMAVSESNMAQFKLAIIINLSENEWMKFFLCKWWEPILASLSEFERKYYNGWIWDGRIQDGRIQDGCQYQFRWEWLSLSQIELVWVRARVEWECFWGNLREDNKVSEFNMAEFKMAAIIKLNQNEWVKLFVQNGWILDGRILDDCHHQVESEWMSEVFFVQMVGTNPGKCEWVWEKILWWLNPRWSNSIWHNSRWLPSSS